MHLRSLDLFAFRNHAGASLQFDTPVQLIVGPNARGKTNLVEAVYVLGTGRSFRRSASTRELIQAGQPEASVRGSLERDGLRTDLQVRLATGVGRRLFVNGHEVSLLREYVRHIGVVAFQPEDLLMIRGGPELRRDFVDRAAFTLHPEYLDEYTRYQRALQSRNQLLRERSRGDVLEAWTEELVQVGSRMAQSRGRFLAELLPRAQEAFAEIFGNVPLTIRYEPNPSRLAACEGEAWSSVFREELEARLEDDRERGFTGIGPHRDDIVMEIDGRSARTYASQGQTRALALALRVAQIRHAAEVLGSAPLFILDDVGSELDEMRRGYLSRFLESASVQAFITATEADLLPAMGRERTLWQIGEKGILRG